MKINVVYISKKKVQAVRIKIGKKSAAIRRSLNFSLAGQSLDEIFSAVAKSLGKNIRILLNPSLFPLYTLILPLKTASIKTAVEEKLVKLTSEKIADLVWDFQEIGQTSEEKIIQAGVLQKDLLDKIVAAAKKQNLEIEFLEPVAYSLARLSEDKHPHLLLHPQGKKVLALVLDQRKVLNSLLTDKPEKIEEMLAFVKDKFKVEVNKVVLNEAVAAEFKNFCNQKDLEIQSQNFNPVFALALAYESLLSILPQKEVDMSEDFAPRTEELPKPKKGKKVFWLFFLAAIVLAVVFGVRKLPLFQPQPSPSPSPKPEPVEEVVVEPELDRADLKLQVLNGSGEKGVAGIAQEYLEELGYQDVDAANAEDFDYEDVQIEIKQDKEEYLPMLKEDLEEKYTVSEETATLNEDSDFDAVVIIGKSSSETSEETSEE